MTSGQNPENRQGTPESTITKPDTVTVEPEIGAVREVAESIEVPETLTAQPFQEYDIPRRRETARVVIAGTLAATFLLTVAWVLGIAVFAPAATWSNTKEALQILLPVESSLLGAAVVFYFTSEGNPR